MVTIAYVWEPVEEQPAVADPLPRHAHGVHGLARSWPAPVTPATRDTTVGLPHVAFFERLSDLSDEQSPLWHAVTAGLLSIRLVDRWLTRGVGSEIGLTLREMVLTRRAVDMVADEPLHAVLIALIDACRDAEDTVERLFDYGIFLEDASEWPLALDVYESVRTHSVRCTTKVPAPLLEERLGRCLAMVDGPDPDPHA
jgi:hypothetical protein